MISPQTLEAVNIGVLTDQRLKEAIKHYRVLEGHLKCHGAVYHLVWLDVVKRLEQLESFSKYRWPHKNEAAYISLTFSM